MKARTLPYQTLAIGARSGIARPAKMVVRSQAEWERVWGKHNAGEEMPMSAPPVDWGNKAVVVLLGGAQKGGALEVQRIAQDKDETTIYYIAAQGDSSQATQPFHFALLEAPRGKVRFADGNVECNVCAKIN